MKLSLFGKRLAVLGVSAFMALGNIGPAVWQVNAEEPEEGNPAEGITWEEVDRSEFEGLEPANRIDDELIAPELEMKGTVRVSIILDGNSTIDAGYSAQAVANDRGAQSYRAQVLRNQQALAKKISAEALGGKDLDVVWNLTLGANIISANVPYARIGFIKGVKGVKNVVIENRYEAADPLPADDPQMAVSSDMTGTSLISSEFTGAGQAVAIIDTGIDTDHRSFDSEAFDYALSTLEEEPDLITKEDVAAVFDQLNAASSMEGLTADDVYLSSKIPFAFNYVDSDLDVTHDNDKQGEHGSHVAGIAAANRYVKDSSGAYIEALESVKTQGQAPDAQILAMKVFGKGGGAYDSDYFAAIEDAMVLGAASANLSLGSAAAGLVSDADYSDLLDRFTEEDTVVVVSMGNNNSWAKNALIGYLFSDDKNFFTGGSPGSFTNSFTVASVDNDGFVGPTIKAYGSTIYYANGSEANNKELVTIGGEHEYIAIDGVGTDEEMAALKDVLKGKIAVVSRGSTSFFEKANAAVKNGAVATIVYNNQSGTISMNLTGYEYEAPAVSVTLADGQLLKNNAEKVTLDDGTVYYRGTLTVMDVAEIRKDESDYYKMSDFSSWGTGGDLNLKPDITAPGGNIYSVNGKIAGGQSYEQMSGTSMAAPQIAGLTALMHQYIAENDLVNRTGKTEHQLTQSLLMSTAHPVIEKDTDYYYSVLKQGAGLANIADATSSKSLIEVKETTVNGTAVDKEAYTTSYADGKVKALLGADDERTGKYTVTFTITNFSDETVDYRFDANFFTQNLHENYGLEWANEKTLALEDAVVNFTVNGEELKTVENPDMYDFNDDGVFNVYDAVALLEYVVGTRESISDEEYADLDADNDIDTYDAYLALKLYKDGFGEAEPGQTITVTAAIDLRGSLDEIGNEERNGAYVEGYLFATERDTEEGVEGIEHSIPVLGFFGNWSESDMTDKGSAIDYQYGTEDRPPYMSDSAILGDAAYGVETFGVTYAGYPGVFRFGGNPFISDKTYHPERNAINSNDTLSNVMYTQIRNAGAARFTAQDEDGEVLFEKEYGPSYAAYYYPNEAKWMGTRTNTGLGYQPSDVEEGSRLSFTYAMAPEYFVNGGETDWDALKDGALMSIEATVDNTAPELLDVEYNENTITFKVKDNQYIAGVYLCGEKSGNIDRIGAAEDAKAGETRSYEFELEEGIENHLYLDVADYAYNETIYKINLNQEELEGEVSVELDKQVYYVLKNSTAKAIAKVNPWGSENEAVTWSSDDETIATVDENGIITGVSEGYTTITATSVLDENASASAYVVVSSFDIELNGIVWDEKGEVWMSAFNTNNLPNYTKLSDSMRLKLTSAAYGNDGRLYAASLDTSEVLSTLYVIDEETYTATEIGDSSIAYMDICKAPSLGDNIMLGVYGTYVVIIDTATGDYLGAFDFAEDTGGAKFTGIAYEEQYEHPQYGNTDWVWLIDENSTLYNLGLLPYEGSYANFPLRTFFKIAYPVDTPYFQSLYYDGVNLFYSRYNSADDNVQLVMVEDIYNVRNVWSVGYFADKVWPVGGLYQKGKTNVGMSAVQPDDRSNAVIAGTAQAEVEKIAFPTTAHKGSVNAVNTAAEKSIPVIAKVSASPAEDAEDDTPDTFTVTVRTDDESTNGLYVVTYDPEMVELISTKGLTKYNAINDAETGEVKVGFINEEALDADTGVADLEFRLTNDEKRTEIKVTTDQENEDNTGAEDTVVIGPEEDVSYSFATGDNSTWTKESDKSVDFRIKRSINENRTGDHFTEVLLDGKVLDPSKYVVNPDGFTITLKPEFLETLKVGKHTLRVVFDDGYAETTFTIEKAAPNTSDHNNAGAWAIMMIAAALAAFAAYRRRFTGRTDS